ncbi:MAG: beta-N-acetylhexosaminidase, partial [Mucinivorans sp.]
MKKFFILLFILFFEGVFAQNTFSKPFVIPELRQWSPSTGELTLSQKTSLVVDKTQEKELRGVAEQFSEDLNTMFALKVKVKV